MLSLLGSTNEMTFSLREVEMAETQMRTSISCYLVRSNMSMNSHRLVVGGALLGILESLL